MKPIRAFIALNLPLATVKGAAAIQQELKAAADEVEGLRVTWVPPANMHITLRFLGEIPKEGADGIGDLLETQLAGRSALPLSIAGVGAFPNPAKPRVLWLGARSEDAAEGEPGGVVGLIGEINGWLEDLGFAPDKREPHPHLTLGRVKRGEADLTTAFAEREVGSCLAHEVVLYQSVLQRTGAEYRPLRRVPLVGENIKK